jgi:hypothetical protein
MFLIGHVSQYFECLLPISLKFLELEGLRELVADGLKRGLCQGFQLCVSLGRCEQAMFTGASRTSGGHGCC